MNNPYYYPMGYQPAYPQQNQQNNNNGIIWVQGEAGAKSYLVAPNSTVQLWDSEAQTIYLKSADASGMPSMRILDYTMRDNRPSDAREGGKSDVYVTKEELHTLEETMQKKLDNLMQRIGANE